ncbi:hypothetical protein QYF36_019259 [Acer negundo]|nr:hypothetical protein QYF36_019259 [Acer negundo]
MEKPYWSMGSSTKAPATKGLKMERSRSRSRLQELLVKWSDSDSDRWRDKELPTYDPLSHSAEKQRSRLMLAQNAIHVIPLVVLICAVILWFFSNPAVRHITNYD